MSHERLAAIEGGAAPTEQELRALAQVYGLPQDQLEQRMAEAGYPPGQ